MRTGDIRFPICGRKAWGGKTVNVQPLDENTVQLRVQGGDTFTLERQQQASERGESVFASGDLPATGSGQRVILRVPEGREAESWLRIESGNQDLFNRWTGTARLGT